jgi:two-component system, OmpR family, alkaline phosphatase synthesis response regulator PhoP
LGDEITWWSQVKPVYNVLLLVNQVNGSHPLAEEADRAGLSCQVSYDLSFLEETSDPPPAVVILDLASLDLSQARLLVDRCRKVKLPVLVAVPQKRINEYDPSLNPDEFILCPVNAGELLARVKQAIYRVNGPTGQQMLKVGELLIDLERYDVMISGRRISLTYKEFQLLVLLASNPGRVYTREVLLSQVWGYDYLGGTRTVDVHIRRLRSKIEDPDHSFVETIWNVGYRFKTLS